MPLNTNKMPKNVVSYEPIDVGTYPARVLHIIDLGLQAQRPFKGEEKPPAYKIRITYELLDEYMLDENGNEMPDKRRVISEDMAIYSLDADRAKSTKRYFALDPKGEFGGDFEMLVNIPCNVEVTQNHGKGENSHKIYNNVGSVSPMREKDAAKAPELIGKPLVFSLDTAIENVAVFDALPEWVQNEIKGGLDFDGSDFANFLEDRPDPEPEKERKEEKKKKKKKEVEVEEDDEYDEEDY